MTTNGYLAPAGKARRVRASHAAAPGPGPDPNTSESPLAWLRRRRDKDGSPMITAAQFDAGERLRADYTFAQLMPSITARWSPVAADEGRRRAAPGTGIELRDGVIAARQRVDGQSVPSARSSPAS
jgi:hypothetical protein